MNRFALSLVLLTWSAGLFAEACTYNEAILAMQKGNTVRAMALMKMAANDGDKRAVHYLVKSKLIDSPSQSPALAKRNSSEKTTLGLLDR